MLDGYQLFLIAIKEVLKEYYESVNTAQSEQMKIETWTERVKRAVGMVARNVLLVRDGYVEKSRLGDLCRALNARWRFSHPGHDAMTSVEFEDKYRWLDEVNSEVIARRIPRWLA